jgi:hypothetical protein
MAAKACTGMGGTASSSGARLMGAGPGLVVRGSEGATITPDF